MQFSGLNAQGIAEGVNHHQYHRNQIDQEHGIGYNMSQHIQHRVVDLLFLQLRLGLGYRNIVSTLFDMAEDRQQENGGCAQQNRQQRRYIPGGIGAGKGNDHGVDGLKVLPTHNEGRRHCPKSGEEGEDRDGKEGGLQHREDNVEEDIGPGSAHVLCRLHRIVVNAVDGVLQEHHVILGAGKGHDENHGTIAHEPVGIHIGEKLQQKLRHQTVGAIDRFVAGNQHHAAVNQRTHVGKTQPLCALDLPVLREQHRQGTHNVHRHDQGKGQDKAVFQALQRAGRFKDLPHGI